MDDPAIETLMDAAFSPAHHALPSYFLRDGIDPVAELCFVAQQRGVIVGTIRYWPLAIPGARSALLLGPIAVDAAHGDLGIGSRLIEYSLSAARAAITPWRPSAPPAILAVSDFIRRWNSLSNFRPRWRQIDFMPWN